MKKIVYCLFLLFVIQPIKAQKDSNETFPLYKQMETSFKNSIITIDAKNDLVMKSFAKLLAQQSYLSQPWLDKASKARAISKAFNTYINNLKSIFKPQNPIAKNNDGLVEIHMIEASQNIDKNDILQNEKGGINSKGLQYHINKTRESLIKLLDDVKIKDVSKIISDIENSTTLRTDEDISYLENSPTPLVLAMLTKYECDCKNLESELLDLFLKQVKVDGGLDNKFEQVQVNVIPVNGNLILQGEPYEAKIFISSYNASSKNKILVKGYPVRVENGVGTYTEIASVGEHKFKGQIQIPLGGGEIKSVDFESGYLGLETQVSINPEKMNILYTDLLNPISIKIPGYRPDQISVTISAGCSITGTNGRYSVSVPKGCKEVIISAYINTLSDSKLMGTAKFRVKNMPLPSATFGFKISGNISLEELNTIQYINCNLSTEFPFEGIKYIVNSFTISYTPLNEKPLFFNIDGNRLTEEVKSILNTAKKAM